MRNTFLIATTAGLGLTAAASAAYTVTNNFTTWSTAMTSLPVTYTDPGSISNLTGSGSNWSGGDGWEAFTLTAFNGAAPAVTTFGTAPAVLSVSINGSTVVPYTTFEINFVGNEVFWGPTGTSGIFGVSFNMTYTGSGLAVSVNGGVYQSLAASNGTVAIAANSTASGRIDSLLFSLGSGESATITGFTVGVIPAPGAVALLGVAGLVGGRRRR